MTKELVDSTRIINELEIYTDDDVAEDEIELDYFPTRRSREPLFTVKFKATDLLPKLFREPQDPASQK